MSEDELQPLSPSEPAEGGSAPCENHVSPKNDCVAPDACPDDAEIENWDWDFVWPEPKERWTQEVTLIYRGREKPGQMVFPDEIILDDEP